MNWHILLYQDEDGAWIAEVPALRGCGSDGATREEALENVKEAIAGYLELLLEDKITIPEDYLNPELHSVAVEIPEMMTDG